MSNNDLKYFELLKEIIAQKMKEAYPGIPESVAEWKGHNIVDFQTELSIKLNETISEKWFYMHMKSKSSKLPRVDILNILSKYAGYLNWDDFKNSNAVDIVIGSQIKDKSNRVFILVPVVVAILALVFYLAVSTVYNRDYTICLYDGETNLPVKNTPVEARVIEDDIIIESLNSDSTTCLSLKTKKKIINLVLLAPGYQNDTIELNLKKYTRLVEGRIWMEPLK